MKKNIIKSLIFLLFLCVGWSFSLSFASKTPDFDREFLGKMTEAGKGEDMSIVDPSSLGNISKDKTVLENIQQLLYPWQNTNLFNIIKNIALFAVILFIALEWIKLIIKGKNGEDITTAAKNLGYIALWALFIRWASWLFGKIFFMPQITTIEKFSEQITDGKESLGFEILSLLKGAAFFYAIIIIAYTGFKVIKAWDGEKGKTIIKGMVNVLVALLIIKGVDYIYYIASEGNFVEKATDLIKNIAKIFGYLYGAAATWLVFFAWYALITDNGWGEWFKKAKNRLINLVVSWLVLFSFFLIIYQIFSEFK